MYLCGSDQVEINSTAFISLHHPQRQPVPRDDSIPSKDILRQHTVALPFTANVENALSRKEGEFKRSQAADGEFLPFELVLRYWESNRYALAAGASLPRTIAPLYPIYLSETLGQVSEWRSLGTVEFSPQ